MPAARVSRRAAAAPVLATKERILDETIELVAERGLAAISVRDITEASGVNVAAVNYHFGSKDELLREIMLAVFTPVRTARQDALARVLDGFGPGPAPVEAILTALIEPLVKASRGRDGGRTVVRFMQHMRANPADPVVAFVWKHFDYGAQSFIDALARALPDVSRPELTWRYEFVRGAAIHMLSLCDPGSEKLQILAGPHGMIDLGDDDAILNHILSCALSGIRLPATWSALDPKVERACGADLNELSPRSSSDL